MQKARIVIAAGTLLSLFAWHAGASAQPVAEKPVLAVGDLWQFARVAEDSGKRSTWSRAVVEIPAEGYVRVRYGNGSIHDYDDAMNFVQKNRPDDAWKHVKYPLNVGDTRQFVIKHDNPNVYESGDVVVSGYETITVPAGTFACYRVEASRTYVNRTYTSNVRRSTRWYCPEVKWIAREVVETTTRSTVNPASNGTTTEKSELMRFAAGK